MAFSEPVPLVFSPEDGTVHLQGMAVSLYSGMTKALASSRLASLVYSSIDYGNGYEWLQLKGFSFGDLPCGLGLCFSQGEVCQLSFGVVLPDIELVDGWPTRDSSQREVQFIRAQLSKQLKRSFASGTERFQWGSVWSMFDERGQQAASGLRYLTDSNRASRL